MLDTTFMAFSDMAMMDLIVPGVDQIVRPDKQGAQQLLPPASWFSTHVPLDAEQHTPLQWPAEPGGPAHQYESIMRAPATHVVNTDMAMDSLFRAARHSRCCQSWLRSPIIMADSLPVTCRAGNAVRKTNDEMRSIAVTECQDGYHAERLVRRDAQQMYWFVE